MIRFVPALSAFALAAAVPAAAQQAARDFQLPPAPTPTTESRVQGPVDTEGAIPVRPRAIETARPATQAPAPSTTTSAAPAIVLPAPAASRAAASARTPAAPTTATRNAATEIRPVPTPLAPIGLPSPAATASPPLPSANRTALPPPVTNTTEAQGASLPWLGIALGALAAAATAAFFLLRRRPAEPDTPTILAPLTSATPVAPGHPAEALVVTVEAMRMDRSVMNATVGYRMTLRNRTTHALTGLVIEADLVSASKDRPAEAQLASPGQALTPRHVAERLAPGQSLRFEGQVRLPLAEVSAIWQGRVGLLVPLLRVRATAAGAQPVATTLVIGRREGAAARPQPFRLDEPPRSYAPLAQRVLEPLSQHPLATMPARA